MTSTVHFRMFHGKESEPISFTGQSIRVLDLKRQIVEKKSIKTGLDFDFEITDAADSSAVYHDDEEFVPKNASVVVKRKPSAAGAGLMAKLANSSYFRGPTHASADVVSTDIVIPMKEDSEVVRPAEPAPEPVSAVSLQDEAEMDAINAINTRSYVGSDQPAYGGAHGAGRGGYHGGGGGFSRGGQRFAPGQPLPVPPPFANYVCKRCKKSGHYIQHCPTNNDPEFDLHRNVMGVAVGGDGSATHALEKVHGLPVGVRKKVKDLSGVDVSGKVIIQSKDGSGYEILAPSAEEYEQLVREGGAGLVDVSRAPTHIKCPLSAGILVDAVLLPCCLKIVSDAFVRQELLKKGLRCPSCGKENVSPEELKPVPSIRAEAEQFLAGKAFGVPPPPIPHPGGGYPFAFPPPPMGPPGMMFPGQPPMQPFMPFMPAPRFQQDMWMPPQMPMWDYPAHMFPPPLTKEEFLAEQRVQAERKEKWGKEGDGWLFSRDLDSRRSRDGDRKDERRERPKDDDKRDRDSSRRSDRREKDSTGESRRDKASDADADREVRKREADRDRDRRGRSRESERRGADRDRDAVDRKKDERRRERDVVDEKKAEGKSEPSRSKREEEDRKRSKGPEPERVKEEKVATAAKEKDRVRERDSKRPEKEEPKRSDRDGESRKTEADSKKRAVEAPVDDKTAKKSRSEKDRAEKVSSSKIKVESVEPSREERSSKKDSGKPVEDASKSRPSADDRHGPSRRRDPSPARNDKSGRTDRAAPSRRRSKSRSPERSKRSTDDGRGKLRGRVVSVPESAEDEHWKPSYIHH